MITKLSHVVKSLVPTLVLGSLVGSGCARPPATSPDEAFRETNSDTVNVHDDIDFAGLRDAIQEQQRILQTSGNTLMQFGPEKITRKEYGEALQKLCDVLRDPNIDKNSYIKNNFRFFEIYGGARWGEVLLTGYFEPIIPGSLTKTARFSQPLYAKPSDLVIVDLKRFAERFKDESALRGRLFQQKVTPYFSRSEIDEKGALAGRGLELCWVEPIDAFFLHIQGSGTIVLPGGKELHLTYAEKNGLRYEPIGKYLKERISPYPVTMQRIEAIAQKLTSAERAALFAKNPSYIFFTKSKRRALTSLGVPATPGRTIAADPRFAPKGALALIRFNKPLTSSTYETADVAIPTENVSRFVLDQDSGGAITGTDHIDLFWGRGNEAKKVAGILQDRARILYLLPKK